MVMTALQRKAALVGRGVSITSIAAGAGVTPQHVSQVMNCEKTYRRSPRIEAAIADAIGKPVSKVFPKATQGAA